jgi:hypothetical protein
VDSCAKNIHWYVQEEGKLYGRQSSFLQEDCCEFQHQRLYIWILSRMKHHRFACVHHRESDSGGRKAVWKAKFLPPGTKLHPNNEDLCKLRECIHLRLGPKALMKTRLNTNTQNEDETPVSHVYTTVNPAWKCSPPSSKLWVCLS